MVSRRKYLLLCGVLLLLSAGYCIYYACVIQPKIMILLQYQGFPYQLIYLFAAKPLFYGALGAFLSALFVKYTILNLPPWLRTAGMALGLMLLCGYLVLTLGSYWRGAYLPHALTLVLHPQVLLAPGVCLSMGLQRKIGCPKAPSQQE